MSLRRPRRPRNGRPLPRRLRPVPEALHTGDRWALDSLVSEIEAILAELDLSRPDERLYRALDSWAADRDAAWCSERDSLNLPVIREPSCGEGCDHCCYQHVAVLPIEAEILARHLGEHWPEGDLDALRDRLSRDRERLASIGADSGPPDSRQLALSRLRRPCPLLDEASGRCLAYEARPVNCRRENSIDPEVCRSYRLDPDATESSVRLARFDMIWGAVHIALARASAVRDDSPFQPLERALARSLG